MIYFDKLNNFQYNIFMSNTLNTKEYFNPLNDYFIRYLFTDKGSSECILLDFINSIMLNANMKTFRSV